jgi:hypothetical protein
LMMRNKYFFEKKKKVLYNQFILVLLDVPSVISAILIYSTYFYIKEMKIMYEKRKAAILKKEDLLKEENYDDEHFEVKLKLKF